jgi:SAM-dependent methyltransferase
MTLWQRLRVALGLTRLVPAQAPLALALRAHAESGVNQPTHVLRGEGFAYTIDSELFFDVDGPIAELDRLALDAARGRVLDVGAGAGRHCLALQTRGLECVAIDVAPECVALMRERGVAEVHEVDVFQLPNAQLGGFDTLLFLMQSIGIAGSRFGLESLLETIAPSLADGGQILLDSSPLTGNADSEGGEVEVQFAFRGSVGERFSWLYLAYPQLEAWTTALGWRCEQLAVLESGDYLARLTKPEGAAATPAR